MKEIEKIFRFSMQELEENGEDDKFSEEGLVYIERWRS